MATHGVVWLLAGIVLVAILALIDQARRTLQARRDRSAPEVEKYLRP